MGFFSQDQQAFFEGHVEAFKYYGGVLKKIRYNLGSAVCKVLKGRKRQESEKFIILRSHYLFEAVFCTPGIKGAHENSKIFMVNFETGKALSYEQVQELCLKALRGYYRCNS